eukprot:CAMPEP_0172521150 /NCGR_PEP_ID=MMETSP1066-20121228/292411_1 /TAXON_ID=671091 /ORGANISM="Coscinodiscus wailesii, Strain CCMP2513" /LENGTH=705 /DNA_ID=CAMNT_0013304011 /DNA_START=96 /DNA_END=2210 /DNA_ORIENTATION=-
MWISSYEANFPSEDRNASLINVLLQTPEQQRHSTSFIRLSLWCVLDGHGGGAVASYASEVLLPHIAANISRVFNCQIVGRGRFTVSGNVRNVEDIDFEGLLRSTSLSSVGETPPFASLDRKQKSFNHDDDEEHRSTAVNYKSPDAQAGSFTDGYDDDLSSGECEASVRSDVSLSDDVTKVISPPKVIGTHSPSEISAVKAALTRSFLAIDEGWINSIDSTKKQTACVAGGRWNAGSCALVACVIQRIETVNGLVAGGRWNAGSCALVACVIQRIETVASKKDDNTQNQYPAMLYTAHCGDCRAVLGTVARSNGENDGIDDIENDYYDESSSDDDDGYDNDMVYTDDSESSDDDNDANSYNHMSHSSCMPYLSRPAKRQCRDSLVRYSPSTSPTNTTAATLLRRPLHATNTQSPSISIDTETDNDSDTTNNSTSVSTRISHFASRMSILPSKLKSIDLTTDHNPYNSSEASLVVQRSNNAPRAISPASNGGIKRVAGSLAVTRALGDAYLKTPQLSFSPYQQHVPYITAQPEIGCRLIKSSVTQTTDGSSVNKTRLDDRVLVLACDGVWEQAEGKQVIDCVQSFYKRRQHEHQFTTINTVDSSSLQHSSMSPLLMQRQRSISRRRGVVEWLGRDDSNVDNGPTFISFLKDSTMRTGTPSDAVIRLVLNNIRRSKNMSMRALMSLPKGKARRRRHDDITACVVDLAG